MKVAIVAPYRSVTPHFDTELEIAQRHLDAGDEVVILSCDGQLANCDFNAERKECLCNSCRHSRAKGVRLLSGSHALFEFAAIENDVIPEFSSLQALIDWRVESFDVGYACLSSLVSAVRDPEPDLVRYQQLLNRFIHSAMTVWMQTRRFLELHQPDRVYVYNGRFCNMRAVFRACQALGVDCFLHERGCSQNHYDLLVNHLPHDIDEIDAVIRQRWAEGKSDKESTGASWFEDRLARVEKNWISFTKDQTGGRLPETFDHSCRNVAIFCSSDDEFVAIGDAWKNPLYPNQVKAIAGIASSMLVASPETKLFLRVHPNLKDVDNNRTREMLELDYPNLEIIAPGEAVDTYALLKASDLTVTFGSSVGIEAVYWGKPSVLLGPSLYQNLGGPLRSASHAETLSLLCADLEPASDKTGALMYGHWYQTRGYRYKYFVAESHFRGEFKGIGINDKNSLSD